MTTENMMEIITRNIQSGNSNQELNNVLLYILKQMSAIEHTCATLINESWNYEDSHEGSVQRSVASEILDIIRATEEDEEDFCLLDEEEKQYIKSSFQDETIIKGVIKDGKNNVLKVIGSDKDNGVFSIKELPIEENSFFVLGDNILYSAKNLGL